MERRHLHTVGINLLDASMALLPNFGQCLLSLPAEAHVALHLKKPTFKLSFGAEEMARQLGALLLEVQLPAVTHMVMPSTSVAAHHSLQNPVQGDLMPSSGFPSHWVYRFQEEGKILL